MGGSGTGVPSAVVAVAAGLLPTRLLPMATNLLLAPMDPLILRLSISALVLGTLLWNLLVGVTCSSWSGSGA